MGVSIAFFNSQVLTRVLLALNAGEIRGNSVKDVRLLLFKGVNYSFLSTKVNTLIVGASAAGLSCAAHLKRKNIPFEIIEKQAHIGHAWRNHYDRLHLHTNKSSSNLPFVYFPKHVPKYPSRPEVVNYLENYCQQMGISPKFNIGACGIYKSNGGWVTRTEEGEINSQNVVICTGNTNVPRLVTKKGIESFRGKLLHSCQYKNGTEFIGQKVLVIGFGNSACEIAICLHEHGAFPSMSVRSPVNVVPRDILGIPVLQMGILLSKLPPGLADNLSKPLVGLTIGNVEKYGLKKLPYGPFRQILKDHNIPLLDIGTIDLIKKGRIKIFGDIRSIEGNRVSFDSGSEHFDAIIMATGYQTGLEQIIDLDPERREDLKYSIRDRRFFGSDNLYFCGFHVSPGGMLREINKESEIIAKAIHHSANIRKRG